MTLTAFLLLDDRSVCAYLYYVHTRAIEGEAVVYMRDGEEHPAMVMKVCSSIGKVLEYQYRQRKAVCMRIWWMTKVPIL